MRAGEEFSAELSEYGSSYVGGRYGSSTWSRTPGRNRMPAEAEDALGPSDSPRGYPRGRSGLYYSPPGTSYTIVERPSSGMHQHSSRDRELSSHHYSKSPRGTYLGSNPNFDRTSSGNNKKRPISPEQVLRLFGSQNQSNTKLNVERPRRSPASSPASTTHQVNYRPPPYGFSVHELVTRTVTMVRDPPEGTHGFGICVKGGKEAGVGVYISRIEEGSVAERAGLRPGDSILEVNGTPFTAITHEEALKTSVFYEMSYHEETFDIEQEYLKNANLKREDMKLLRQWVETQLHYLVTSDLLLFVCLHSCYYDIERAKATINSYHNLRAAWPEVFKNRNPCVTPFLTQLDIAVEWPLQQYTKEGYKVFLLKLVDSDASKYDMDGQIKLFFVVVDYWISKVGNCKGFIVVLDNKGITWAHLLKFGLNTARKLLAYVQEGLPVRLKGVHIINANTIVDKFLFIARIFMKKELNEIVHVHTNLETFYQYIPQNILPKDYGGDDVTLEELHEMMRKTLQANFRLFLDDEEQKIYEEENKNNNSEWDESEFTLDNTDTIDISTTRLVVWKHVAYENMKSSKTDMRALKSSGGVYARDIFRSNMFED